jgi:hypothetical protein
MQVTANTNRNKLKLCNKVQFKMTKCFVLNNSLSISLQEKKNVAPLFFFTERYIKFKIPNMTIDIVYV